MQSQNPLLDELAKAASAAVGVAQAAGEEAKAVFRSGVDRMAADMDLVRRDEFEAMKAEVAALRAEIASLRQPAEG
ncbi:MAG TPA: accessory factor UbiK family protein [Caulobacteraceae bacterium]|nr:accessory factor UbiK family protein [Caulobacteraceae bacterium]